MMRYRIKTVNFDSRAGQMTSTVNPEIEALHEYNQDNIRSDITRNYGTKDLEQKIKRFTDFGNIPFLITWKYNTYFNEIRRAYVAGSPYSALVSSCTLVERILNYIFNLLKNDYDISQELVPDKNAYNNFMKNNVFIRWDKIIPIMQNWGVIKSDCAILLGDLKNIRDSTVHYDVTKNEDIYIDALETIHKVVKFVDKQFSALNQPYLFYHAQDGAIYVKDEFRLDHYVKKIVIPNTQFVSTNHKIAYMSNSEWIFTDTKPRKYRNLSDEQFLWYRERFLNTTKQKKYTPQDGQKVNVIVATLEA